MSSQVLVINEMLAANKVGSVEGSDESIKKCGILSKTGKLLKGLKLSKSGNSKDKKSVKSKKPSKNTNSPNFDAKKAGLSFLTPKVCVFFNKLWLTSTKAPIF